LLLSASISPGPDVVALSATAQNDGIVHVTGSPSQGAFAVATVNLGAGAQSPPAPTPAWPPCRS
jgi:threonine/homoserine/homoserine lactone efflux protein